MKATTDQSKPVYAIVGDRFLRREELDRLCRALQAQGVGDMGLVHFEGSEIRPNSGLDLADVLDELRTPALIGGPRLVIVDEADEFISSYRAALERYCSAPTDATLVLVCDSLPGNQRIHKIIAQVGEVRVCAQLTRQAAPNWLRERARAVYSKQMGPGAVEALLDLVGPAAGLLDAELGKLAAYVGGRASIEVVDVEAAVGDNRERNLFAVTDALGDGDAGLALRNWEKVAVMDRSARFAAIGGLAWAIRRWHEIQEDAKAGVPLAQLTRKAFTTPQRLSKMLQQMPAQALRAQVLDLLRTDVAIKSGQASPEVAIERFIVKHSVAAAGRFRSVRPR